MPVSQESLIAAVLLFITIFVGSLLLGAVFGGFSALAFRSLGLRGAPHHAQGEHKYLELAFSFCFPWSSYFIAEALELSGIVAILACGMTMATFTRRNLSIPAVEFTSDAYR